MNKSLMLTAASALAALAVTLGVVEEFSSAPAPTPAATLLPVGPSTPPLPHSPSPDLAALLASLRIVDELPEVPGYERGCENGSACVFGPAWTDNYPGPGSHNGCDSRNDVLRAQLRDVTVKPGTRHCKVLTGTLDDPYTGATISFTTDKPSAVQIDHVYPLARAWRAGASTWTLEQRTSFANDIELNLLAVDGRANQQKSDQGLDTWLPPHSGFRCDYAHRYLSVAQRYQLAITRHDATAAVTACATT